MSSVLTPITGAVRSNLAGLAGKAVRAGTNQIKSIAGLNRTGSNSQLATQSSLSMRRGGTNVLTYPINVDSDPQQGHYILFEIEEIDHGKLAKNKNKKGVSDVQRKMELEYGFEEGDFNEFGAEGTPVLTEATGDANILDSANGRMNRSIVMDRLPTVKHHTTIALYMPPSISVTYNVNYNDKEVGTIAGAFGDAIVAFLNTPGNTVSKLTSAATASGQGFSELAQSIAMKSLDTFASGAQTLLEINKGSVITPRMEMMFEGVGRRSFTYTFVFIPKSSQETDLVEKIVKIFKTYMMPEYKNSSTRREMLIPDMFNIKYMYGNAENDFINKVSKCFLKDMTVEYGADRFTAYAPHNMMDDFGVAGTQGAPPQKTKITLLFNEIETLSRDHILRGY